jgi:8-oxo-dGTP diphosphatase
MTWPDRIEPDPDDPRSYPAAPMLAVSTAVFRDGRVLLARRGRAPRAGIWSLPGGLVEPGERLAEAALRELLEETGVEARIVGPTATVEVIRRDATGRVARHFVVVSFAATWLRGEPRATPEASEIAWVVPGAYGGRAMTEGLEDVIARAAAVVAAAGSAACCPDPRGESTAET